MIEFIIPTCKSTEKLRLILQCLIVQTSSEWKASVVFDGDNDHIEKVKSDYSEYANIKFDVIEGPNNDWGHTPREFGKNNSTEQWIVMTGDDNYYVPTFVETCLKHFENNGDAKFIYCNMIHNHYDYNNIFETEIARARIDIGCFVVRGDLAKEIDLIKEYEADWFFVEKYVERFCKQPSDIVKISSVLYVHN